MEKQALAQTRTIERGFWNDRKEPDPRRKPAPAPLSIMRSCTRNYAPRFSGIAKNSRPCSDSRRARFLSAAFVRLSFIPWPFLPSILRALAADNKCPETSMLVTLRTTPLRRRVYTDEGWNYLFWQAYDASSMQWRSISEILPRGHECLMALI